jgi:cytochrome c peroxidase
LLAFFGVEMNVFLIYLVGIVFSSVALANPLLGLPPLSIPQSNQQSVDKIELGRLLFNDARLSVDNTISCASCHKRNKAFTDGLSVAEGINGLTGLRNAPTVVNSAFYETFFLDGREGSLETQSVGPLTNPIEHGLKDYTKVIRVVSSDNQYSTLFNKVFGISANHITIDHVAKAIASFERTLIAGNSLFDQYYFGRDHTKLSESAARGLRIFRRKGNCANCHEISFDNALFMDNRFYNIGVGFNHLKPKLNEIIFSLKQGKPVKALDLSPEQLSELGRFNVTNIILDIGKYKTPTLRNISLTAPYMHDGSMKTLEEVVDYYDKGGDKNRFIDPAIYPLHFTKQEKIDLVAFMKSLTSPQLIK